MKKTRVVTLHSMPPDWRDAMTRHAKAGRSKSSVYAEAFDALSERIENGERVRVFPPGRRRDTISYRVKLPAETVDRADAALALNGTPAKKSPFAAEAVRRFLNIPPP